MSQNLSRHRISSGRLRTSLTDLEYILGEVVELKKRSLSESSGMSTASIEALRELCCRIDDLGSITEGYFLSIGTKVQEYSDSASGITRNAISASEIMGSVEIKGAIKGLVGMVDQLEDIFHRTDSVSNNNIENLRSIGWSVRSIEKELIGLGDTARDLKMLALSTKIQSTRTSGGSGAFMQLGRDIAKMSVIISSKSSELFNQTSTLSDFVSDVQTTLHDLKEKQKFQTENVLKGTRGIIGSMDELTAKSEQEAERMRHSSENISMSVSDVVTSVQYQDITRQSLDKVVEGLKEVLEDPRSDGSGENGPFLSHLLVSPEILVTGQYLRQVHRLEKTDALMQETLEKMAISLEGITDSIEKMAAVTRAASRDSNKFLHDLETAMSFVTSFLKEVVQSNLSMSDSMNSLAHTVEDMSEFTGDIEMISSEVELISLNARIMAAQTGVEGSGMGVIAQAVQETAGNSEDRRISVVAMLSEISRTSVDLKAELESATRGDEVKLDQLVRELGVFLDALRIMQEKIVSMLGDIDEQSSKLNDAIKSSIHKIRDQIHLERRAGDIARDMNTLALNSSAYIKPADLVAITGDRFKEEEIQNMGHQHRLKLVDDYFSEHCHDDFSDGTRLDSLDEGDVVFFDDNN
jgi:methyl-accepting chemotaxis protein